MAPSGAGSVRTTTSSTVIFLGRGPEGSTMHPPTPNPYKTMFFWTLKVSTMTNTMLTVKSKGLTTDLQLFSKGTLKTPIRNYHTGNILLWQLWPCNSRLYVLNDLVWYQMKDECFSYHISTRFKPKDHSLTNYCHFNYPTPKCISKLKKNIFFTVFV